MSEMSPAHEIPRYHIRAMLGGIGPISPDELQRQRLPDLLRHLDAAYETVHAPYVLPYMCLDGRQIRREDGDRRPDGPTAAGGTLTMTVARDLVGEGYISPDLADLHGELASAIASKGYPVGGHCQNLAALRTGDRNLTDHSTGCWANDNLASIYHLLRDRSTEIAHLAKMCGFAIDHRTTEVAAQVATSRLEHPTWLPMPDDGGLRLMMHELREADRTAPVELASGPHRECAIVLNAIPFTTIDRTALRQLFPSQPMDVFSIDAWAIRRAAYVVGTSFQTDRMDEMGGQISDEDARRVEGYYQSMMLFNFAAVYSMCGPSMPIIVRE